MSIDRALEALRRGEFVLLHDGKNRENEVDLVILAEAIEPQHVATMRRDAGGLICVALHPRIADSFGLPYLTDIYREAKSRFKILKATWPNDIPYDERSAFSITVNHRKTFTGITDEDRALTISELGKLGAKATDCDLSGEFGKRFRSPGHVHLLRAANGLLNERKGHTELVTALAELAGVTPVVAICEMLDSETNRALSREKAREYGLKHGIEFLDGAEVIKEVGV
ncbi:MAG: 3,4-dihydroxy-2-butanone-4-phosphate synthase [Candidatus Hadarchaeum sp.]|uniref:3,4-dihydroxy-2-butanone-4-phosphate synthase n=1 Tax=Candidatus Hadarchaeum sp. TaxID=2883567 RepID=UPI0031791762